MTALLGPNGAGKTTLLDMILGLNTPDSGRISLAGSTPRTAVQQGRVGALLQTGDCCRISASKRQCRWSRHFIAVTRRCTR